MRHSEYNGRIALVYYRGVVPGEDEIENHMPEKQHEPERILLGSGEVVQGVSEVLYDMEIGEERTVIIPCEKAYGKHDPNGVQRYPRTCIPGGDRLETGTVFAWSNPVSRKDVPVVCVQATKDTVTIDFNHLLAGKDLEYWFKLVDVVDDSGISVSATN